MGIGRRKREGADAAIAGRVCGAQVVMQDRLLRMGRDKQFEKRLPSFPVRRPSLLLLPICQMGRSVNSPCVPNAISPLSPHPSLTAHAPFLNRR